MRAKTREAYAKKMQRRPPPKMGKKRKASELVTRESNAALVRKNERLIEESNHAIAALVRKNERLIEERNHAIAALEFTCEVFKRALNIACRETVRTAEWYCTKAEDEITAEMKEEAKK